MAKIFISYSKKDKNVLDELARQLEGKNHELIYDYSILDIGEDFENALFKAMVNADGTIFLLTNNSVHSRNVIKEFGTAESLARREGKFLIPLVSRNAELPDFIKNKQYIYLDDLDLADKIQKVIYGKVKPDLQETAQNRNKPTDVNMTPFIFSEKFYNYLNSLQPETFNSGWRFEGPTDIAYSTPVGPWETEGFLFSNADYEFVLRSVVENSYVVVESVNLEGQLANLALNNPDKFKNQNGRVTILETYDMTVGYGRRSREDVRNAFIRAGMQDQVITSFHQQEFSWEKILHDILKWAQYRELAKSILLQDTEQKSQTQQNFWLLKIQGQNWLQDKTMKEGGTGYFHADYGSQDPRPELELFKQIRVGDYGFAIDTSQKRNLIIWFEVTTDLQYDDDSRQVFRFKILQLGLRSNFTETDYQSIFSVSEAYEKGYQSLFQLRYDEYALIVSLMEKATISNVDNLGFNKASLSKIFSDGAGKEIDDNLDFQKDVDALAAVMVYTEVTPPLAVGLFGNWGSGKSFFMNKLQKRIEELREDTRDVFCKNVLQINFNSWHYSDANLWASLITKIFEDLEKYGKDKPDELKDLFQNLNSTKELIADTKNEEAEIQQKINCLKDEKAEFEKMATEQTDKLESLSFGTILKQLVSNTSVQDEIKDLKKEYQFLNIDAYEDISQQLNEIESYTDRLIKSVKIIPSFFTAWRIFGVLLTFLIIFGLSYYLKSISNNVQIVFDKIKYLIYGFSALLAGGLNLVRPAMKKVQIAYKKLCSLQKTIDYLKKEAEVEVSGERQRLLKDITAGEAKEVKLNTEIKQLEVLQKKLQTDLDEITSGRKVIRFIESRVSDEKYANSLGIISWVRRDFEQLDFLLRQQKKAKGENGNDTSETPIVFDLERIILYIDDLDRCAEPTVVKVLEAMNLLLAFPLFVVVVGVDPRWMHNALHRQYPHLKNGFGSSGIKRDNLANTADSELLATSSDYLEKIFQIPFVLKPMTQSSKASLIAAQLKSEDSTRLIQLQKEKIETDNVASVKTEPASKNINPEQTGRQPNGKSSDISNTFNSSPPENPNVEKLLITEEEEAFMQGLAFLIGDSPRTIKRFINIFRILRTHEGFRLDNGDEQPYYYAAIIILAVITGRNLLVNDFFEMINTADDNQLFLEILSKNPLLINPGEPSLYGLLHFPSKIEDQYKMNERISALEMTAFKANLELVSRFSFSSLQYHPS